MTRPSPRVAPIVLATLALTFFVLSTGPPDRAVSQTDQYWLETAVFSGGGAEMWGEGARLSVGTMGQPSPIGICQGENTVLYSGFWGPRAIATSAPSRPLPVNHLEQNIPNPFNPVTRIDYQIAEDQFVSVDVFNLQGRQVQVLVQEQQKAGPHHVMWHGRDELGREVASGIYFYRLQAGQYRDVKRMLLLK